MASGGTTGCSGVHLRDGKSPRVPIRVVHCLNSSLLRVSKEEGNGLNTFRYRFPEDNGCGL
jgi:hypothetical protein